MRVYLAGLVPVFLVGGCSWIYNPSNINKPPTDAAIDMKPPVDVEVIADADPTMLELAAAYPPDVYEGVGTGGSRPAVVVLYGHNIAQDAQVALAPTGTANLTITDTRIASDGNFIMLAIQGPIDIATGAGVDVPVAITVTQPSASGPVVKTLDAAITYHYLDELTDANVGTDSDAVSAKTWSKVDLQAPVTFDAGAHGPVLIRSMSSISVDTIDANAGTAPAQGPGGCAGGAGGGVAGQGAPGGCAGGGGGGVVELTARGDVTVTAIHANGGAGAGPNGVASGGGGGAGGVIVVRAGGTLTGPVTLTATKGAKGANNAGDGSDGRTRYDAATVTGAITGTNAYQGPMWTVADLFATQQTPMLALHGGSLDVADVRVFTKSGDINDTATANFGQTGNAMVMPQLKAGYNNVCVTVTGGSPAASTPESTNCIEMAFLP